MLVAFPPEKSMQDLFSVVFSFFFSCKREEKKEEKKRTLESMRVAADHAHWRQCVWPQPQAPLPSSSCICSIVSATASVVTGSFADTSPVQVHHNFRHACVRVCVRVCMCVYSNEEGRERGREKETEREGEGGKVKRRDTDGEEWW